MEEWKVIEGYEHLQVSNFGRVYNDKTGRYIGHRFRNTSGKFYRRIKINKVEIHVHRLVALTFIDNPDNKICVDHADGNGENNNITNLRWATVKENNQNQKLRKDNSSGFKGITKTKSGKYRARICVDGKSTHLGNFTDLEQAKKVRDEAEDKYFKEFKHRG